MFANVALDGFLCRVDDDTPDAEMENAERRQCPVEKTLLAAKWKTIMEGLLNHYQYAKLVTTSSNLASAFCPFVLHMCFRQA
jgi:hypothetical protein